MVLFLFLSLGVLSPLVQADGMVFYPKKPGDDTSYSVTWEARQLAGVEYLNETHQRLSLFIAVTSFTPGENITVAVPFRTLPEGMSGDSMNEREFRDQFLIDVVAKKAKEQDPSEVVKNLGEDIETTFMWGVAGAVGGVPLATYYEFNHHTYSDENYGSSSKGGHEYDDSTGGGGDVPKPIQEYDFDGGSIQVYDAQSEGLTAGELITTLELDLPEKLTGVMDTYSDHYVVVINAIASPPIPIEDYLQLLELAPDTTNSFIQYLQKSPALTDRSPDDVYDIFITDFRNELKERYGDESYRNLYYDYRWILEDLILACYGEVPFEGYMIQADLPLDNGSMYFPLGTSAGWENPIFDTSIVFQIPSDRSLDTGYASRDAYIDGDHFYLFSYQNGNPNFDIVGTTRSSDGENRAIMVQRFYNLTLVFAMMISGVILFLFWAGIMLILAKRSKTRLDPKIIFKPAYLLLFPITLFFSAWIGIGYFILSTRKRSYDRYAGSLEKGGLAERTNPELYQSYKRTETLLYLGIGELIMLPFLGETSEVCCELFIFMLMSFVVIFSVIFRQTITSLNRTSYFVVNNDSSFNEDYSSYPNHVTTPQHTPRKDLINEYLVIIVIIAFILHLLFLILISVILTEGGDERYSWGFFSLSLFIFTQSLVIFLPASSFLYRIRPRNPTGPEPSETLQSLSNISFLKEHGIARPVLQYLFLQFTVMVILVLVLQDTDLTFFLLILTYAAFLVGGVMQFRYLMKCELRRTLRIQLRTNQALMETTQLYGPTEEQWSEDVYWNPPDMITDEYPVYHKSEEYPEYKKDDVFDVSTGSRERTDSVNGTTAPEEPFSDEWNSSSSTSSSSSPQSSSPGPANRMLVDPILKETINLSEMIIVLGMLEFILILFVGADVDRHWITYLPLSVLLFLMGASMITVYWHFREWHTMDQEVYDPYSHNLFKAILSRTMIGLANSMFARRQFSMIGSLPREEAHFFRTKVGHRVLLILISLFSIHAVLIIRLIIGTSHYQYSGAWSILYIVVMATHAILIMLPMQLVRKLTSNPPERSVIDHYNRSSTYSPMVMHPEPPMSFGHMRFFSPFLVLLVIPFFFLFLTEADFGGDGMLLSTIVYLICYLAAHSLVRSRLERRIPILRPHFFGGEHLYRYRKYSRNIMIFSMIIFTLALPASYLLFTNELYEIYNDDSFNLPFVFLFFIQLIAFPVYVMKHRISTHTVTASSVLIVPFYIFWSFYILFATLWGFEIMLAYLFYFPFTAAYFGLSISTYVTSFHDMKGKSIARALSYPSMLFWMIIFILLIWGDNFRDMYSTRQLVAGVFIFLYCYFLMLGIWGYRYSLSLTPHILVKLGLSTSPPQKTETFYPSSPDGAT